jgi:plasmid replication initiation protein
MEMTMKNLEVRQSNALIEASYTLALNEYRALVYCMSKINQFTTTVSPHTFYDVSAADYSEYYGLKKKSTLKELRRVAKSLLTRIINIDKTPDNKPMQKVLSTTWVAGVMYDESNQKLAMCFSAPIIPYIHNLKVFYTIKYLANIRKLSNLYAARIYDYCLQYLNIGTREFNLSVLKKELGVDNKYKEIYNLKKKLLEPALKDVNKNTDIYVEYETIKSGVKVTGIRFNFTSKKIKVDSALIKKEAEPGESYKAAKARLEKKYKDFI